MLKSIGVLSLFGICVVAAIGLAGGGPFWFRYVGSGVLILLLLSILSHVTDLVRRADALNAWIKANQGDELAIHEELHRAERERRAHSESQLN